MYPFVLTLHSWVRWLVLGAGVLALIVAVRGARTGAPWPASGKVPAFLALLIAADVQLLLGVALWATSPLVTVARAAMGPAMKSPLLRFWAVEHGFTALLGIVLVHVGYALAKQRGEPTTRFRRAAWTFGLALVCLLAANPWPWRLVGRPWFRL